MNEVEIEYCVPCSLLPVAMRVAEHILTHNGRRLSGLRLKTGSGGVFKVRVDGDLVWDEDVATVDPSTVARRVEESLEVTA